MGINVDMAVAMVKQRKDMLQTANPKDLYIEMRVKETIGELRDMGIHLVDAPQDMMLVVDIAVWKYNNRDKSQAEPQWLRDAKNTRWINDRSINERYSAEVNGA